MPVEAKPLFRPDVLGDFLAQLPLPPHVEALRPRLTNWAKLLASPAGESLKEREHLPDFLTLFAELLGYRARAESPERWTMSREKFVEVDGKYADAAIGLFRPSEKDQFVIAVEGKGSKDPLDRPHGGRRLSAVEQGYRYATNFPCDWIIVSSMRQTRLYHKGSDQQTYERFDTEQLAKDDALLRKFIFLLGAPRMVPVHGPCHLAELRTKSEQVGRTLTHEFYLKYAGARQDAFLHLARENPDVPKPQLLQCTQKLLDRILFCAFCQDRDLLPAGTIKKAYEHADPYNPRPIWDNFKGLFRWINEGNPRQDIEAYNGGLFKPDDTLNGLTVSDEVCRYFHELGEYNYRPAHQIKPGEAASPQGRLIDVDILGHIFEQSITDLEKLRLDLFGMAPAVAPEAHQARRKKEGAFYTPAFITRYIVEQALGRVLDDRFEKLRQGHAHAATSKARDVLADPKVYQLDALKKDQRQALVEFWQGWQQSLKRLRVLDPACGSGAFLIQAFDYLHKVGEAANDHLAELRDRQREITDLDKDILQNNLYGVDLNEEAVEMCRLSLWIKTAARGKQLTSLDHTIVVGNSVVGDPAVDPKALDWHKAFPEVFEAGGFDVVVGNPPYVRQELLAPIKDYLKREYRCYAGAADLFLYFFERGLSVLKPAGLLGYITSGTFARSNSAIPFRQWLPEVARFERLVNFGENQPFEGAEMVYPTIAVLRKGDNPRTFCTLFMREKIPDSLDLALATKGLDCDDSVFQQSEWKFQPAAVTELFNRLMGIGSPLGKVVNGALYRGLLTGLNEAFIVDDQTRSRLIAADPSCKPLLRKMLRGEDFRPWYYEDEGRWLILINGPTKC